VKPIAAVGAHEAINRQFERRGRVIPIDGCDDHNAMGGRPGIRRRKSGKGFSYTRVDGSRLSEADFLKRIKALAVPPAWTDVWICPFAEGHIQATGRDA
jgi:hypothetical protein